MSEIVEKTNGNGQHLVAREDDDAYMRLAMSGVPPEVMRQYLEIQQSVRNERARLEYFGAMARSQAKYPVIKRTVPNTQISQTYKYAPYEIVWEQTAPIFTAEGLSVSFITETRPNGNIHLIIRVRHVDGFFEDIPGPEAPPDTKGIKGSVNKTDVQGSQSTITYMKKGLLCSAMGIVTEKEDDDGQSGARTGGGQERGPVSPPPNKKKTTSQWAHDVEERLAGPEWYEDAKTAFSVAPTMEDLEAFVSLIKDAVGTEDKRVQDEMGAALHKARKRLATKEETVSFEFPVYDHAGETDGELFTHAQAWAQEFLNYWEAQTGADERENLLHHNTDALKAAEKIPSLKDVVRWKREVPAEPTENQKWGKYQINMVKTIPDKETFDATVEAIKPRMQKVRKEDPETYKLVLEAFNAKNATFA